MRADLIRIYRSLHTWTGIISGMALFIAFYAGALAVFKEPIARWASPPPPQEQYVPLAQADQLLLQTLKTAPDSGSDFVIHIADAENIPARMSWQRQAKGAEDHDQSNNQYYLSYLEGDGQAVVRNSQPSPLADFIDVLHRVVGLPVDSDLNRWIMGVVATLYGLALVSGLIIFLPTLAKEFLSLRVEKSPRRLWRDAHNVVGIISLPFHLVMALTAIIFAFHDGIYDLQRSLFQSSPGGPPQRIEQTLTPRDPAKMLPPLALIKQTQAIAPGFAPYAIQYQNVTSEKALVRIWGKDATAVSPRARGGFLALDPYSGRTLNSDYLPGKQGTAALVISSFFALHMAAFGGSLVQWLYFLLGMAGAWLFYNGNLLWVENRRHQAARNQQGLPIQRRDARLLAAATVGVCLGCICGISLTIAAAKWLPQSGSLLLWHQWLYYTLFFASIGWAFLYGAARAAIHLLWLASALTLAIPATTLLAALWPQLGLWAYGAAATLGWISPP